LFFEAGVFCELAGYPYEYSTVHLRSVDWTSLIGFRIFVNEATRSGDLIIFISNHKIRLKPWFDSGAGVFLNTCLTALTPPGIDYLFDKLVSEEK
jgi:hypothetical protein